MVKARCTYYQTGSNRIRKLYSYRELCNIAAGQHRPRARHAVPVERQLRELQQLVGAVVGSQQREAALPAAVAGLGRQPAERDAACERRAACWRVFVPDVHVGYLQLGPDKRVEFNYDTNTSVIATLSVILRIFVLWILEIIMYERLMKGMKYL